MSMKAVGYTTSLPIKDPKSLFDFKTSRPKANDHDLLVATQAISVNPVDTKVRMRKQAESDEQPVILGWDAVGEIVEIGNKVEHFNIGDRVWYAGDLTRPGANSEFHLIDERIASKAPNNTSNAEAASLPLTAVTAYEMLFDRLKVQDPIPGAGETETLVIIGGAGGVGSIAIQLAKALTNLQVIATASRPETRSWVEKLGADYIIDHSSPLVAQIDALGLENMPAYVFSTTHTHMYLEQIAQFIAPQGRFGLIDDPNSLNIMPFKQKSISTHWEFMYTRSMFKTADMNRQAYILAQVANLVDDGKIICTTNNVLGRINAENIRKAHDILERNTAIGKIVLEGW